MNLNEARKCGYSGDVIKYIIRENLLTEKDKARRSRNHRRVQDKAWFEGAEIPLSEATSHYVRKHKGKNFMCFLDLIRDFGTRITYKIMPAMGAAFLERELKLSNWEKVVWSCEHWANPYNSPLCRLHMVHVSEDDKTQVAFTQDEGKLLRNIQTRMKPGRYLMKYFGPESDNPVLSEAECKMWADRQLAAVEPVELHFAKNTQPNVWEWVYENSPNSCMRYNRNSRYLDYGLDGVNHPVRAYAHPDNDLALAYIMRPGFVEDHGVYAQTDSYVVAARTIVNLKRKSWLRIYAEDDRERSKLTSLLKAEGYSECCGTLSDQVLQLMMVDDRYLCPYIDGENDRVEIDHTTYTLTVGKVGIDACRSMGVLDPDEITDQVCCPRCGGHCDEDDMTYVDCRGEIICQDCLNDNYSYAYVGRYQEWVDCEDVVCTVHNDYYTAEGAEYHDIRQCAEDGEWYSVDDMLTLDDGSDDMVHMRYAVTCIDDLNYLRNDCYETVDGWVHEDNAVWCFVGNTYVAESHAYKLDVGNKSIYVHREALEDPTNLYLFVRCGDLLLPNTYYGYAVTEHFVPSNLTTGDNCDYDEQSILAECWGLEPEKEDENVLPLPYGFTYVSHGVSAGVSHVS